MADNSAANTTLTESGEPAAVGQGTPSPPPPPPPCLANLPTEIRRQIVAIIAQQDENYRNRLVSNDNYREYRKPAGMAQLYGCSLLQMSLVNRDFAALAAPFVFRELKGRRCLDPAFQHSVLISNASHFQYMSLDGSFDDHWLRSGGADEVDSDAGSESEDDDDDEFLDQWDDKDRQSVRLAFTLLPILPNITDLNLGSRASEALFGLDVDELDDDTTWATLQPSDSKEINLRRAAFARLAPRFKSYYLCHWQNESNAIDDAVALSIGLFTNLRALHVFFENTPLTIQHVRAIASCPLVDDLHLEMIGPELDPPVSLEPWTRATAPKVAILRISSTSRKLIDLAVPFAASLEHLVLQRDPKCPTAQRPFFPDVALLKQQLPAFSNLADVHLETPAEEAHAILSLLHSAPLDFLQLRMAPIRAFDLPVVAPNGPLFDVLKHFPDALVTLADNLRETPDGIKLAEACAEANVVRAKQERGKPFSEVAEKAKDEVFRRGCAEVEDALKWALFRLEGCRKMNDWNGIKELGSWLVDLTRRMEHERD